LLGWWWPLLGWIVYGFMVSEASASKNAAIALDGIVVMSLFLVCMSFILKIILYLLND
jgi:hypothetical protein